MTEILALIYLMVGLGFVFEIADKDDGVILAVVCILLWPLELGHFLGCNAKSREHKKEKN